ncbi:MAG: hypothetical protein JRJ72_11855 [Deltaproteobacteria bacterium]|nr:hypothetical protein [Deltaproteobacteria bacterium]
MAETTSTQGAAINEVVGKVFILYGKVKAIAPDGTVRILTVNSPVFAMDRIVTESDGSVAIMFDGPPQAQIEIGRMSDVLIDEDVYAGATPEQVAETTAEVEDIQAMLQGEGEIELEAPAAGGPADSGGGHPTVVFDLTANEVVPDSGAETTGPGDHGTVEPYDAAGEGLAAAPPDNVPDFGVTITAGDGAVQEAEIVDSTSGTFDIVSPDGIAAVLVNGQNVTGGGTVDGEYGTLVVTVVDGVYHWEYTLSESTQDHDEQGNDTVLDNFSLQVEDPDGDTAGNELVITVVDDVPTVDVGISEGEVSVDETDAVEGFPISATSEGPIVAAALDYGADGPGAAI